ncbi:hypothetical protein Vadar_013918 [Vaccinium darrowii]|uniref:Uncharacterized protein n=1 Tax=Vaccinium darrowii TaxID=229202 RepID=A0ACB7Z4L8_9ERIC|nr:hypothetical protein Vadar_013918 [Vaccinium darrowii]
MNSLIRNATLRFSRRSGDHDQRPKMSNSLSYRRERANKRRIFLRTYNLASSDNHYSRKSNRSRKLKKVVAKVKSALVSVMLFARFRSLRPGSSPSPASIFASPVRKCF